MITSSCGREAPLRDRSLEGEPVHTRMSTLEQYCLIATVIANLNISYIPPDIAELRRPPTMSPTQTNSTSPSVPTTLFRILASGLTTRCSHSGTWTISHREFISSWCWSGWGTRRSVEASSLHLQELSPLLTTRDLTQGCIIHMTMMKILI